MKKQYASINDILKQIFRVSNNNLKLLTGVVSSFLSEADSVTISLKNSKGETIQYEIPSYSFLRKKQDLFSQALEKVYQILGQSKYVNPSHSQLIDINPIKELNFNHNFYIEDNIEFENFYDKKIFIKIDLTDKIHPYSKFVYVEKFILKIDDTSNDYQLWLDLMKNQTKYNYQKINEFLIENEIEFVKKESIETLNPGILKYKGSFGILDLVTETKFKSDKTYSNVKKYQFSTIYYSSTSDTLQNLSLKQGDILVTKDGLNEFIVLDIEKKLVPRKEQIDAKIIDYIDNVNLIEREFDEISYFVTLGQKSGYKILDVGNEILYLASQIESQKILKLQVIPATKYIIFLKPIDPFHYIVSSEYSPPLIFDSNNLVLEIEGNKKIELNTYTNSDDFTDYKNIIEGQIIDNYTPSIPQMEEIKPVPPILRPENFKVIQINQHLTSNYENMLFDLVAKRGIILDNLAKLETEKLQLLNTLSVLSKNAPNYGQVKSQYEQILNLINQNQKEAIDYSQQINEYILKNNIQLVEPKYRVCGFWNIPEAKVIKNKSYHIIKFRIRYRYLNLEDKTSLVVLNYVDADNNVKPTQFSLWNEIETNLREKRWNNEKQVFEWLDEIELDKQEGVKINQLNLPISPGEKIEIQVASIIEAGYPFNEIRSDWSSSIIIEFPSELLNQRQNYLTLKTILDEEKTKTLLNSLIQSNQKLLAEINSLKQTIERQGNFQRIVTLTEELLDPHLGQAGVIYLDPIANPTSSIRIFYIPIGAPHRMLIPNYDYIILNNDSIQLLSSFANSVTLGEKILIDYKYIIA